MRLIDHPSPNHGPRPDGTPVDILLLHYTGMVSAEAALTRLTDPASAVSAHYLIDEDGAIRRLVPEARRAWHAGIGHWAGAEDINSRSIGVELVNPGHEFGYRAFPYAQMTALTDLARGILGRHPIPPRRVLGHSDVAPERKQDPGELFDWAGLAAAGIGLWPDEAAPAADGDPATLLRAIGYAAATPIIIAAFQRHFRPHLINGELDDSTRRRIGQVAWAAMRDAALDARHPTP